MGFFDFVSSAVGAVKNLVSHSPIIKSLAPLAGIIAHAVPMVGPVIDNAIPAIEAIFSKDNASPNAGEDPKSPTVDQLNAPVLVVLKRQEAEITAILQTVKNLKDELGEGIKKLQADFKSQMTQTVEEIQNMFKKQLYDKLYTVVRDSGLWIESHKTTLNVTASDDPDKFKPLLFDHGNLLEKTDLLRSAVGEMQTDIEKPEFIPAQQMLDLYLLAIHWLLIFNKAIIVTRGIYARALYVDGQKWTQYLEAVRQLDDDITALRNDAIRARDVLLAIVRDTPRGRAEKVHFVDGEKKYIQDDWPFLSVGWIPLQTLRPELGYDDKTEIISYNALALGDNKSDAIVRLWREYAVQAVDFNLRPARAVVANLEENIRQWNSRIPVAPMKTLPAGEQHINAQAVASKAHPEWESFSLPKEDFVGKKLRYNLTYSNTYGESYSSALSPAIEVSKKSTVIQLDAHPVAFDNDPLISLPLVTGPDGKGSAPERSVRRRIYVGYTENHGSQDVRIFLGEIDERQNNVYHTI